MAFGHFDDSTREYVITTPHTPYPWINYLGSERFFSLISHTAGGYCFYRDARLRRLLRYRYNNVPTDLGGRYLYVVDGDDAWTPGFMPMRKELDSYSCRHGLGYTRITSARNNVEVDSTFLVPLGEDAEVCRVTVRNTGAATKSLKLFSLVEFCLWNAQDDMTNFQRNYSTGEVEVTGGGQTLYHKTEYRERRDHFAYYHVNAPVDGFDTDRESFLGGVYGSLEAPAAVVEGQARNSVAHGWSPIGSHALSAELAPGASKTFVFVLGYAENPRDQKWEREGVINKTPAEAAISRLASPEGVQKALDELSVYWEEKLGGYQIQCSDPRLARMVNTWNPYQCMVTFNLSRSASYFEAGIGRGMGFRDSNQDLLGVVHMVPERSRARILDIAATQRADGSAYHQYQPLTKRGNNEIGSGFNDDPLWLILAVAAYIQETGDMGILDEPVPFDNDESQAASLFVHLERSFSHVLENLGPHGLPLIGRADWNDCLNLNCFSEEPDEPFQTTGNREGRTAESLMIAGMFTSIGPLFESLCRARGLADQADAAAQAVAAMRENIRTHGCAPDWFLRAYDFFGDKVGSPENEDGQIFIESQGFCIMGGVGVEDGFAERALDAVEARLDTPYGIVLCNPAYRRYHKELGEITSYPPGYKENAGIFCHNNPWIVIAETVIGRAEKAFNYWKKTAPAYIDDERQKRHRTEPYVYAQMIAGKDAHKPGEAKNAWLTGTAAWNYVAITQHILGVRPTHEGLQVAPCLPLEVGDVQITRRARGATYEISIKNKGTGAPGQAAQLTVDGQALVGTVVPWAEAGATVQIRVEI